MTSETTVRRGDLRQLSHSPARDVDGGGRPRCVLYIEDNVSAIALVERILSRRPNVELLVARTGEEGIDLATHHSPDVIFSDINLPDVGGEQLLDRLAAHPATHHIPIVVVSADANPNQIARLTDAGAAAYLTKPFDLATFLSMVDESPVPTLPRPQEPDLRGNALDPGVVEALRELADSDGGAAELIDAFDQSTTCSLTDLREAVACGDLARTRDLAHSIRGASAIFGAPRLAARCETVEELADAGRQPEIAAVLDEIATELVDTIWALHAALDRS